MSFYLWMRTNMQFAGPLFPNAWTRGLRHAAFTLSVVLGAAGAFQAPAMAQQRTLPDFTDLVEQVSPSVVNIRTSERAKTPGRGGAPVDPGLEEFFKRFGIPMPMGSTVPTRGL